MAAPLGQDRPYGNGTVRRLWLGLQGLAGAPLSRPPSPGFRALPLLARFLDFMEVNATFYHPIGGTASRRWLEETPSHFHFVIKAWQGWTHHRVQPGGEELTRFREVIDPILEAGRLEGVLAQYPPSMIDTSPRRDEMLRLRRALDPAPLFVEVRDRSLYRRGRVYWAKWKR